MVQNNGELTQTWLKQLARVDGPGAGAENDLVNSGAWHGLRGIFHNGTAEPAF
jgi:hypothetical protein